MSSPCSAWNYLKCSPQGGWAGVRIRSLKAAGLLVVLSILAVTANWRCTASQQSDSAEEFFNSTNLLTFSVELDEAAFEQLTEHPRTYVRGRVRVGEQVWEQVGIRLKGSGTFQPVYERPSLTLKFNWKEAGQRFAGLNKLLLENSGQDATRMCKLIANAAYSDAGIAAPRITHARVLLNGRDLGRYVVSEAINKQFLKAHFGDDSGNLYEADFRDINRMLKQANGAPGDQSDLRSLARAAAVTNGTERLEALGRILDTDEFLNYLALEMILANWDGYAFYQNNYRLYHDPASGRITFIPHDLDNTLFESGMCLMPPRNGLLTGALLDTTEARQAFRARVERLAPKILDAERIKERVNASIARLSQGMSSQALTRLQEQAALLETRAAERLDHIRNELAGRRPQTPEFDSSGVARLSGWTSKSDWNGAEVRTEFEDDLVSYWIDAERGYCFGSWRLPVWLPAGRYRVEGSARVRGVAGLPSQTGSGAGLRVIGTRRGSGLQGDCSRWTLVRYDFTVQPDCEWVELIAELRAFSGSAWFDPDSLRLTRLSKTTRP
ncbi:MAG TPA: CotH kinase family protein [Verrucomicrobiae bacterium]|nr:CotH kinase family protein [Verrucomicrobiae bacterium]